MALFDIHTHVYPEEIAQKATDSVKDFYRIRGADMDGTTDMLLAGASRQALPVF